MNEQQVRELLRKECEKSGTQKTWADANGVSSVYVSDVLRETRTPGKKLLDALGIEEMPRSFRWKRRSSR